MKLFDCLHANIVDELQGINDLRELRIRNGGAVKVNVAGKWCYLGVKALRKQPNGAIVVDDVCDNIIKIACCNSVYAHERTLANGFFTLEDGVRIGVCGSVFGLDKKTFQSYTSLCFRIPHYVNCVDADTVKECYGNNVLVLGAPATGKTTFLRDLAVKLAERYNVLVCDERGELFYDEDLLSQSGCDVLKWCTKAYAFNIGVRAMSPHYLVCDELSEDDLPFVKSCAKCGVNLVCSAHSGSIQDFSQRFGLADYFGVTIDLNTENKAVIS